MDGIRIPTLSAVFDLVRQAKADHVRFNIETKLTPTSGADTPEPETFAGAVASAVSDAGLTARVAVQSFDWRTLARDAPRRPGDRAVCLTIERPDGDRSGRGAGRLGMDARPRSRRFRRLGPAARGRGRGCTVWSPNFRNVTGSAVRKRTRLQLKVIPWTVNERADMARLIPWA